MIKVLIPFIFAILFLIFNFPAHAQTAPPVPSQKYFRGEVVKVIKEETIHNFGQSNLSQALDVKILEGPKSGEIVKINVGGPIKTSEQKRLKAGDQVIVLELTAGKNVSYSIWDRYRLDLILFALIGFFVLVVIASGAKGFGSILGLIVSVLVLIKFIVPQILAGRDPVLVSIAGAIAIMITTIFLAHGFSKKTTVAVVSTAISLILTGAFALIFVKLTHLSGLGDEAAYSLQLGPQAINLQGLLLGGIIIGALGVLDDVTTTQSAAVFEIKKTDPRLSFSRLFTKAYSVGREHISSLVNTLVLAYAGASLGLFVVFVLNPGNIPFWAILNSETIIEEVVRTLAGSIGLILAVPITTLIASYIATRHYRTTSKES